MIKIFTLLLSLSVLVDAATIYYVDPSGGSDANNGTDPSTPWLHYPGDPSATGIPAATTVNGDTLYLKGGTTYLLSGSAGVTISSTRYNTQNGVTFSSGVDVGWGATRPKIEGNNTAKHWFQLLSMTNVTIKNLEFQNTVGASDGTGALYIFRGWSNTVNNCYIHDSGTNLSTCHEDCLDIVDGVGNNIVTNCYIYNATQRCIAIRGPGNSNNIVTYNICGGATDHDIFVNTSFNTIFGNTCSNAAVASIWLQASVDPGFAFKFTSSGSSSICNYNLCYNNVAVHNNGGIQIDNNGTADMVGNQIYNNDIVDVGYGNGSGSPSGIIRLNISSTGRINESKIRNNIFYGQNNSTSSWSKTSIRVSGTTLGTNNMVSHNLYGTTGGINIVTMIAISGTTRQPTLANFADNGSTSPDYRFAESGHGTGNSFDSSTSQIFNIDPVFKSYPGDLAIAGGSPCIGVATNLSSLFTTDILGRARVNWSIGAYESPNARLQVLGRVDIQ